MHESHLSKKPAEDPRAAAHVSNPFLMSRAEGAREQGGGLARAALGDRPTLDEDASTASAGGEDVEHTISEDDDWANQLVSEKKPERFGKEKRSTAALIGDVRVGEREPEY